MSSVTYAEAGPSEASGPGVGETDPAAIPVAVIAPSDGSAAGASDRDVCFYCTAALPSGARLCAKCGKWRSRFRNGLVFWSGFTGLVTLVASALLFIYAFGIAFYARHYGADLRYPNISSLKDMSVLNNSSVDIVLGTVRFSLPGEKEVSMIVDRAVASGEIVQVSLGVLFARQTVGGQETYFGPAYVDKIVSLAGFRADADARKEDILAQLESSNYEDYTVEAINVGGSDYRLFEKELPDMIQVPCTIEVDYQVVQGNSFTDRIGDCIGLVRIHLHAPRALPASSTIP